MGSGVAELPSCCSSRSRDRHRRGEAGQGRARSIASSRRHLEITATLATVYLALGLIGLCTCVCLGARSLPAVDVGRCRDRGMAAWQLDFVDLAEGVAALTVVAVLDAVRRRCRFGDPHTGIEELGFLSALWCRRWALRGRRGRQGASGVVGVSGASGASGATTASTSGSSASASLISPTMRVISASAFSAGAADLLRVDDPAELFLQLADLLLEFALVELFLPVFTASFVLSTPFCAVSFILSSSDMRSAPSSSIADRVGDPNYAGCCVTSLS